MAAPANHHKSSGTSVPSAAHAAAPAARISQNRNRPRPARRLTLRRLSAPALFFLIATLTLGIAAVILILIPPLLGINAAPNDVWAHLNVIVSVLTFAFAIGAGVSVLVQISEANESRNLDLYRDIYEKLMSDDEIAARRYIYQAFPDFDPPDSEEQKAVIASFLAGDAKARDQMKQVLNLLDYFGFLIEQDWMTATGVIDWLSPVVAKLWLKIGPLVVYECQLRPEEPDYYLAARKLAHTCQEWRAKHYPDAQPVDFNPKRL